MNKPIEYWIRLLPDGYRERAIRNHEPSFAGDIGHVPCMSEAIDLLCYWRLTPEGHNFWSDIKNHYLFREQPTCQPYKPLPKLPTT